MIETMHTSKSAPLFLGKLSLPVDRSAAGAALGLAEQVAEQLKLDTALQHGLSMVTEEAFVNAVTHFSGSANPDERVHVEFTLDGNDLVISIRERGIPFRFEEAKRYSADSLDSMELPGLGSLLINHTMDSVEYFVHGRDGKETRLRKQLPAGTTPPYSLATTKQKRHAKRRTLTDVVVREPTDDELTAVCQLAWRCYGYSQEAFLYVDTVLREKIAAGLFRSLIAIDEASGQIVGHSGLKYHEPGTPVPEVCAVFLDPMFRLPGVSAQLSDALYDLALSTGAHGTFDSSVTTHPLSQKMSQAMGCVPCCIMFGIAAAGMKVRELATTTQPKGSVINHYFALNHSPRKVFAPTRHQEMMQSIYSQMKLPREFMPPAITATATTDTNQNTATSACSLIELPEELRAAFIIVHTIGHETFNDIAAHLRTCRMQRLEAVYVFLSLGDEGTPALSEQCENIGFSFAGLMPHIHDGDDRLLFQYVDVPIDMEKIRIYGSEARALFDYVRTEKERVSLTLF